MAARLRAKLGILRAAVKSKLDKCPEHENIHRIQSP